MPGLFEAYLRVDPAKAVKLAQEMQGRKESKEWADRLTLAQTYIEVNQQVATGNTSEAVALLDKLKAEPYSSNATMLARLRARVMAGARQLKGASESLLQRQANSPDDEIYAMLRSNNIQ